MTATYVLTAEERRVFRLFESVRGKRASEWAAAHMAVDPTEPGGAKWDPDLTPYLREPMDAVTRPGLQVLVGLKAARVGWSLAVKGVSGFLIDCDPGPQMWVQPDRDDLVEFFADELKPLVTGTPRLAEYLTGRDADVTNKRIRLTNCRVYGAWASSANTLRRRTVRYLFLEEAGGYAAVGSEGDVVALARKRTVTYKRRARTYIGSSPTTKVGHIWQAWTRCSLHYEWWLPCPHCGHFQVLDWDRFRYPAEASADEIQTGDLAWYECAAGKCPIRHGDLPAMNRRGLWAHQRQTVHDDGRVTGETPPAAWIGYRMPAWISPFLTWSEAAADFVRAQGDPERLMVWHNTVAARPFEIETGATDRGDLVRKRDAGGKPGEVPDWCGLLLATADTQKRHFVWTVRAWGPGGRSRLVAEGIAHNTKELRRLTLDTRFPTAAGHLVPVHALLIDSGGGKGEYTTTRTEQVYQFANTDPDRIIPTKGSSDKRPDGRTFWYGKLDKRPREKPLVGVRRVHFKPDLYKDRLARLVATAAPAEDLWELHSAVGEEYFRQMLAEHKVIDRKLGQEVWQRRTDKAVNDYLDCEVLQLVAADYFKARQLTQEQTVAAQIAAAAAAAGRNEYGPRRRTGGQAGTLDRIAARIQGKK